MVFRGEEDLETVGHECVSPTATGIRGRSLATTGRALARTATAYARRGPWPWVRAMFRFFSAPLIQVAAYLPERGVIVDVGCGQGHFLHYCHQRGLGPLIGIEPSPGGVRRARACLSRDVMLVQASAHALPLVRCRCCVAMDVLYLLEPAHQEMFIAQVASALEPEGVLLLKTMEPMRRVRQRFNHLQEWLAVRVFRITLGRDFSFRTATEWETLCRAHGLEARSIPLWKGYLHPHVLIVARKGGHGTMPMSGLPNVRQGYERGGGR